MEISNFTATDLQHEILGPISVKEYRKEVSKRMEDGRFMNNLAGYTSSMFQEFECYIRTEVDLVEGDIRLVVEKYNSSFITSELLSGVCTFKNLSEVLSRFLQTEYEGFHNAIHNELDDITMKTKLVVRSGIIAIRSDERSFFYTILGFNPHWDYKQYNEYLTRKKVNLSTINKIRLECAVIDGSIQCGKRQPILFSFVLDKPAGYKVFQQPETIQYKKKEINLSRIL